MGAACELQAYCCSCTKTCVMFGFCFMVRKRYREFFAFHRYTMCCNGHVSSAYLVSAATNTESFTEE